jgi:spore maturation protein A
MANAIFIFIFVVGLVYGLATGRGDVILETLLKSPKNAFLIFIDIYTSLIFWGGILEICKRSGLLKIIGNITSFIIKPLFNNLEKDSLALQYISLNLVSNTLSMGSAATPFGMKAMDELKKLNNNSDIASNEMITFLLINVGGFCIIPTTIITILSKFNSSNPSYIIPFIILVSLICTMFSIILNRIIIYYEKH